MCDSIEERYIFRSRSKRGSFKNTLSECTCMSGLHISSKKFKETRSDKNIFHSNHTLERQSFLDIVLIMTQTFPTQLFSNLSGRAGPGLMLLWTGSNIIAVANGSVVLPSRHNITHPTHNTQSRLSLPPDRVFAFPLIIPGAAPCLGLAGDTGLTGEQWRSGRHNYRIKHRLGQQSHSGGRNKMCTFYDIQVNSK